MTNELKINCVIGVDPGANGGLAVYVPGQNVRVVKMPKDIAELREFFGYFAENYRPVVFLEKLSVRPDDVSVGDGRANMGKLYRIQKLMANFEHLKAIIETSGIPYVQVHPMSWMSKLGLRKPGQKEEKADRKRRYARKAEEWYPGVKVALWNADALLLMHFGRWALINNHKWVKEQLPEREYQKLF